MLFIVRKIIIKNAIRRCIIVERIVEEIFSDIFSTTKRRNEEFINVDRITS